MKLTNKLFLSSIILLFALNIASKSIAQNVEKVPKGLIYNPNADAKKDFENVKRQALKDSKNIFSVVGGNWCIWCKRLNLFLNQDAKLKGLLNNYEVLHINYSKENKNEMLLNSLGNPQKLGFPVILIVNSKGTVLHTQNTGDLEKGNSYSTEKLTEFLTQWVNIDNN